MSKWRHVLDALTAPGSPLAGRDDLALDEVRAGVLRLQAGGERYFVKWMRRDDERGQNELRVNREVLPGLGIPAPRLLHVVDAPGGCAACWEWLEGHDLRKDGREALPRAFAMLGEMHLRERRAGSVFSSYTRRAYPSVWEMVLAELELHCSAIEDRTSIKDRCVAGLQPLAQGWATFAHGDVNPANIIATPQGLRLVDWGFAHHGLNLMDLDYIQSEALDDDTDRPWWTIGPDEAGAVLAAYFEAADMADADPRRVHRAVTLLAELRNHTNALRYQDPASPAPSLAHIERLLGR